jgi:hypothetical protein
VAYEFFEELQREAFQSKAEKLQREAFQSKAFQSLDKMPTIALRLLTSAKTYCVGLFGNNVWLPGVVHEYLL